jgi:putative transposase
LGSAFPQGSEERRGFRRQLGWWRGSRQCRYGVPPAPAPARFLVWFAGYRRLLAQKYDGSKRRKTGRPRTERDIEQLILRMARENPRWDYTRVRGALRNLGHEIGRNTIKRILAANGVEPATKRRKGMSWEMFLNVHPMAVADFFTVEALTRNGVVRFLVFFVMELKSRRVKIAGPAPGVTSSKIVRPSRS